MTRLPHRSNALSLLFPILLSALAPSLAVAQEGRERYEFTEIHMGVPVRIVLYAEGGADPAAVARTAFDRIASLEGMLSDYRSDSELRRLEGRAGEWVRVSPELFAVLEKALQIARLSDGSFDPTLRPLVSLWREARRTGRSPESSILEEARSLTGWWNVQLNHEPKAVRFAVAGMGFELGGIAKGFILDEALAAIEAMGVDRVLLEAGGDIRVSNPPPDRDGWRIEAPWANASVRERAAALSDAALATSGPTTQFVLEEGLRYSHVLNPRTGVGLTNEFVATVIAPTAMLADALATASTVLGPEEAEVLREAFPEAIISVERVGEMTEGP